MALKLRPSSSPPSSPPLPFPWPAIDPPTTNDATDLPSPPTSWLSARDMKLFGAQPLSSTSDIGLVRCNDCHKPILRSFMADHVDTCTVVRIGRKGAKGKASLESDDAKKASKKRKASPTPDDPNAPAKKKAKPATKVTKGRIKGPVDFDKHCGVINDKGLPCSRSLTCKSHSMGAKRSVEGRSRPYDELFLDWQRANKPNFVEPVKRESKAEKKEKREREKQEKKRLAEEAAAALGLDPSKKAGIVNVSKKKKANTTAAAAAAAAASRLKEELGGEAQEDLEHIDSEAEMDDLVHVVQGAIDKAVICTPLAVPCDAGSWFVQRRERARCCRDLLIGALGLGVPGVMGGVGLGLGLANRPGSLNHAIGLGTAKQLG